MSNCCNTMNKDQVNSSALAADKTSPNTATRTASSDTATDTGTPTENDEWKIYDDPAMLSTFLLDDQNSEKHTAVFQVGNIQCAGCCHRLEKSVGQLRGVSLAEVNYTNHQLRVEWQASQVRASDILRLLNNMDYPANPVRPGQRLSTLQQQYRDLLKKTAVAGALGMQIMVLAVAMYAGDWWGMEDQYRVFFRWISLLLAVPTLIYAGSVFYLGAWRDLRNGRIGMDVPVTLGLTIAMSASIWSLYSDPIGAHSEVYFDSVSMFVFLVLGARLLEAAGRLKAAQRLGEYDAVLPDSAVLIHNGQTRHVPLQSLKTGDLLQIDSGAVVPADATIVEGGSSFDESLLTGESLPVVRSAGARILAGSTNVEHPVTATVVQTGSDTTLAGIGKLVEQARFSKPRSSALVESLSGWFVGTVLTIAAVVAGYGILSGSEDWLSSLIAVLIVSCPCALALATPAALTRAVNSALSLGILVNDSRALETLGKTTHVFSDKTGTLTSGKFSIDNINRIHWPDADQPAADQQVLSIAKSLEQFSAHPVARLFQSLNHPLRPVKAASSVTGGGVTGEIDGTVYWLGSRRFVTENVELPSPPPPSADGSTEVWLADDKHRLAILTLRDQLRPGMIQLVEHWRRQGIGIAMLTGDQPGPASQVAAALKIDEVHAACSPQQKLEILHQARADDHIIVMLGDGINDAPVAGAADISMAVGDRLNLTTSNADIVLMHPDTAQSLRQLWHLSRKLRQVIRQNLVWALGYNIVAIPFAAAGLVPPWLAAIGMSLSSLVVVLNAMRVNADPVSAQLTSEPLLDSNVAPAR